MYTHVLIIREENNICLNSTYMRKQLCCCHIQSCTNTTQTKTVCFRLSQLRLKKRHAIPTKASNARLRKQHNARMHPTLDNRLENYYRFIL